jgi:hypothetical protein
MDVYDIDVCPRASDDNRVVLVRQLEEELKRLKREMRDMPKKKDYDWDNIGAPDFIALVNDRFKKILKVKNRFEV